MPRKEWIQELPDGFTALRLAADSARRNQGFFRRSDLWRRAGYDTAHGFAHRDVLDRKSALIAKERYETLGMREAFQHAIHDLKQTSGGTAPSISRIEADMASDQFMREAGFRESTVAERAKFHGYLRCAARPRGVIGFVRRLFRWPSAQTR